MLIGDGKAVVYDPVYQEKIKLLNLCRRRTIFLLGLSKRSPEEKNSQYTFKAIGALIRELLILKEIGKLTFFYLTVYNSTVFVLLNDSEVGPPKSMRKIERSLNCPDLVEQFKMFHKSRGMRRVLFSFRFTKKILGHLIRCLKYFYHLLKYL